MSVQMCSVDSEYRGAIVGKEERGEGALPVFIRTWMWADGAGLKYLERGRLARPRGSPRVVAHY